MSDAYMGEVRLIGTNYAPLDWAYCDGQIIPISQYSALFAILGPYYGGNGLNSFGLPNLQGRTAIHAGQGPGFPYNYPLSAHVGQPFVTLSFDEMPSHRHSVSPAVASIPVQQVDSPAGNYRGRLPAIYSSNTSDLVEMDYNVIGLSSMAATQYHENRQPFLAINYIICLEGVFPPRQ